MSAIFIWSGFNSEIPDGFVLCDGTNGTPDLRNQFVVGAAGQFNFGDTGGQNSISEVPTHSHMISGTTSTETHTHSLGNNSTNLSGGHSHNTNQAGAHTHSTNTGGFHSHNYAWHDFNATNTTTVSSQIVAANLNNTISTATALQSHTHTVSQNGEHSHNTNTPLGASINGNGEHTHSGVTSTEGEHTHSFNGTLESTGSSVDITPVYYAVAFIMEVAV